MQLDFYKNGIQVQSVLLEAEVEYRIGRALDNDIVLDSPSVSRHHAKIILDVSGSITLTDLGSTNGTFLADSKITTQKWHRPQDVVLIGDVQLSLNSLHAQEYNEAREPELAVGKITSVFSDPKAERRSTDNFPLSTRKQSGKWSSNRTFVWKNPFAESILILALILPFAAFLVIDQVKMNSFFLHLVQLESVKAEHVWDIHKQQLFNRQLAKAKKHLASNKLKLCKNIIAQILARDPSNKEAVALQAKCIEAEQALTSKKNKPDIKKSTERKTPVVSKSNEQLIVGYLKTIQNDIAQKNYSDCMTHAQKIIGINPGNQRAVQLINFCNNALAEIVAARQAEKMKKARQEQIKTQLQKILQQGKKAFRKKKYNRSLELLQKGLKLDPGKKYEVTRTIEEQVKRVRKSMRKLADRHVRRAKKEQSSEHPIKALHYYELAQNILPGDEKIKSLYQAQLKANQNSAFNLYNEAIAYASLGGVDEAKTALRQAKKLAKGNKELYQKIKKKLNSLAKE